MAPVAALCWACVCSYTFAVVVVVCYIYFVCCLHRFVFGISYVTVPRLRLLALPSYINMLMVYTYTHTHPSSRSLISASFPPSCYLLSLYVYLQFTHTRYQHHTIPRHYKCF